ncbi:MAG: OadG family protein [Oscillospiraceae bacterium]|jgi:Na+-transporting methylmalonyl-CoA/oxaloacetate decarboxylase gamma subunit|nr:OadG family protein [Oscillospiraceae bacterium]
MGFQQGMQTSVTVLITGLVVVFSMLIFLTLVIKGYSSAVHSIQVRHKQKQTKSGPGRSKSGQAPGAAPLPAKSMEQNPAAQGEIPGEVLAVLAAAAVSMVPGGTVTSVRRAAAANPGRSSWKMAGLFENTRPF